MEHLQDGGYIYGTLIGSVGPHHGQDGFCNLQPHYTQPIHIYGYKDILLVCNNVSFPVRFYICDVKACRVCQPNRQRAAAANIEANINRRRTSASHSSTTPSSSTSEGKETSYLHNTDGHRVDIWTRIGGAYFIEKLYATSSSTTTSLDHQAWIHKSVLQSDRETSLMQLVSTVATDLKLPTGVSPPYSHQSQGKVVRFLRNLFDQLRTTRLQWSKDLNIQPQMLPPESLPWALHHSIFILNNYLVHSSGKTSHFENYRYNYGSNIVHFGEIVLRDIRNMPTQKLRRRNQHQKLRDI